MGLSLTHNCWDGPYSSFSDFRYDLANIIGINLNSFEGYGTGGAKDIRNLENNLLPLFDHSDCEGMLTPDEAKRIAEGLTEVIDTFDPKREYRSWNLFEKVQKFRDGCLLAYSQNENVMFH